MTTRTTRTISGRHATYDPRNMQGHAHCGIFNQAWEPQIPYEWCDDGYNPRNFWHSLDPRGIYSKLTDEQKVDVNLAVNLNRPYVAWELMADYHHENLFNKGFIYSFIMSICLSLLLIFI